MLRGVPGEARGIAGAPLGDAGGEVGLAKGKGRSHNGVNKGRLLDAS